MSKIQFDIVNDYDCNTRAQIECISEGNGNLTLRITTFTGDSLFNDGDFCVELVDNTENKRSIKDLIKELQEWKRR